MNAFEVGKNIIIMSNELYLDVTLEMVEKECETESELKKKFVGS